MSKIFAAEHTYPNIRFNCINPGATRTAMRAKAYPEEDPKTLPTPGVHHAGLSLFNG